MRNDFDLLTTRDDERDEDGHGKGVGVERVGAGRGASSHTRRQTRFENAGYNSET